MIKDKIVKMVYEGLGFPIRLIDAPLRKRKGEWVLNINFNQLQLTALKGLATKPTSLCGNELRFIRHYFQMSTHAFAKLFGVAHAAVLKWENNESKMNFAAETWVHLYVVNALEVTDKEFRKLYLKLNPTITAKGIKEQVISLEIFADKIAC